MTYMVGLQWGRNPLVLYYTWRCFGYIARDKPRSDYSKDILFLGHKGFGVDLAILQGLRQG